MHILGHLTVEEFLRDYWQQKPVLIRNAWPDFEPLLSSSELAGLSLEEEIESRLVEEEGKDGPWTTRTGPFTEDDYRALPQSNWTLLVQAVDHWIPEAANILEHFRFLPSWRIDDLMISYAVNGGSVGPHYDQYDVFLLQAEGQREWRIGQMCSDDSPILKGPKIRVLQQFDETERWTLNPGDMLYLPPQLAHYGIAQGECMTYSIGFRAPGQAELAQAAMDDILASASEDQRYTDAGIRPTRTPGLIDQDAIRRLRALLTYALNDDERLQRVLGKLMTEAKYPEQLPEPRDEAIWDVLHDELNHYQQWRRSEFARFAYSQGKDQCHFFALGHHWKLPLNDLPLVAYLADTSQYKTKDLQKLAATPTAQNLLLSLWQRHMLYSPESEFGN